MNLNATRRSVLGLMASVGSLSMLAGGCSLFYPSSTIRYRMTVEVETPQGLRTGSSVIETSFQGEPRIGDSGGLNAKARGEAVAVDLPGGVLFALLANRKSGPDYPIYLLDNALRNGVVIPPLSRTYQGGEWKGQQDEAKRVKPSITLTAADYPMMVRFADIRYPKSVEAVEPDNLAASFGAGVRLKRIVVQLTDDPVTTGIEKRLGWLDHLDDFRTDPSNPFSNTLPKEVGYLRSPASR